MAKVNKDVDHEPIIKELSLTVARTINMGNYESLRIEATAAATLEIGSTGVYTTVEQAADKMMPHIRKALQRAYDDHVDAKKRLTPL